MWTCEDKSQSSCIKCMLWDSAMDSSEIEGRTFMQAISEKYSPENFPCRRGPGMGVVVVPSGPQGSPMKDRLNLPSVLVLNGCGISHAGDQGEIAAFCAHVVELDLSHNKLQDWHEISKIVSNVPNLEFLNLSSNQLSDAVLDPDCAKAFSSIRRFVLNNTQVSWDTVHTFTQEMPEWVSSAIFAFFINTKWTWKRYVVLDLCFIQSTKSLYIQKYKSTKVQSLYIQSTKMAVYVKS